MQSAELILLLATGLGAALVLGYATSVWVFRRSSGT